MCLERFWSQTHFLRFEKKFSQFFFFTVPRISYYFLIILQILEDCVKLPFCVTTFFTRTTICFSTQRSLVKILQRKLIGKTYNTSSLSNIIGERGVTLQKYMVKIQKDNIVRLSPSLQADSLPLNHWGSL